MSEQSAGGSEQIDEIGVLQAFEAMEAGWSAIRCPNGCYDPYEATSENMRAAASLPRCEKCESFHIVEWGRDRSGDAEDEA